MSREKIFSASGPDQAYVSEIAYLCVFVCRGIYESRSPLGARITASESTTALFGFWAHLAMPS